MIISRQMTNTENLAFIAVLVFKLISGKVFFMNRKDNRSCLKVGYFFRIWLISRVMATKL